jgi:hypothetical protein
MGSHSSWTGAIRGTVTAISGVIPMPPTALVTR